MEQLQNALQGVQRELATVDAARVTAEARSQSLDAVPEELDAEKKRNAALLDKVVELGNSSNAQRAEHERELMEARQQTATERQQTSALRVSLREAMATVRKQRHIHNGLLREDLFHKVAQVVSGQYALGRHAGYRSNSAPYGNLSSRYFFSR